MLAGYAITAELHRGARRVVLRAVRAADGTPVILKRRGAGTASRAGQLRNELDILSRLRVQGVPRPLELVETAADGPVLVLEDAGGRTLRSLLAAGPLELDAALDVAARLGVILDTVHRGGVVHRDVNPSNVLVDAATGAVTLIDFDIATRAPPEHLRAPPAVLEGTVAYMAPEQTGRMNRPVDARADLYALGVTLYEMLTGRLPFDSADVLDVVHGHIARTPVPPHDVSPAVPPAVGAIVLKLMAKMAEDRYQTAAGVASDLRAALDELRRSGRIENVVAGAHDVPDRFVIPQRLYGREADVARLTAAFDAARGGASPLVMVSGYAGIGKTSLIHELHRVLTPFRGRFIAGKFDQLERNVPYGAVVQAFQGLARQVLTEDEVGLARWRARLQDALGTSAGVILDVLPGFEPLLGDAPPVPALSGIEAENRFNRSFLKLLATFATPEHPLVVFLDDLQWADSATLRLLPTFVAERELRGLLVIGAYRDNEVGGAHPLLRLLADVRARGVAIEEIALGPLGPADLEAFVADALRRDAADVRPLAALVGAKTGGNPFFLTQFLQTLHRDGLIRFDRDARRWDCAVEDVRSRAMTDNVVDLLVGRIRTLPPPTIDALRLAACIGGRFELDMLATVRQTTPDATAADLWRAVEEGVLLTEGDATAPLDPAGAWAWPAYRFLHDRMQQAAYALIPDRDRQRVHLSIGRLLLAGTAEPERDERLFDIVNQLGAGLDLIIDADERLAVARLELAAARRARLSAAWTTALTCLEAAIRLLPDDPWDAHYDFAFAVHVEAGECRYLSGHFEAAEATFADLLGRARSDIDRATVQTLRAHQFEIQARYSDAIDAARAGLEPLGIALPPSDTAGAAVATEIAAIDTRMAGRPVAALLELPAMTDARVTTAMRLLLAAWAPAYIAGDTGLIAWIPARMVGLSLEYGNTEPSAVGYVVHGITLGTRFGDYARGFEFGRLALQLNDALGDVTSRAKVHHLFSCFVNPWRRPLATCFEHAREAYRAGLETGDFAYATYACFHETWYGLLAGPELGAFLDAYAGTVAFLRRIRYDSFADAETAVLQWGRALRGETPDPTRLDGPDFDEDAYARRYAGIPFFQVFRLVPRVHLLYTFDRLEEAEAAAAEAATVIATLDGTIWPALLAFYRALVLAARLAAAPDGRRAGMRQTIEADLARLAAWAQHCPETFRYQQLLVAAELASADGRHGEAVDLYEGAVLAAGVSGLVHAEALCHERAGRYWLGRDNGRVAAVYLRAAVAAWERWGATARAAWLRERVMDPGDTRVPPAVPALGDTTVTTVASAALLDLASIMKAAGAIAEEIRLDALLERLLGILIENAGARRGALVLEQAGEPVVRALGGHGVPPAALPAVPLAETDALPAGVIHLVRRTGEPLVVEDALRDATLAAEPWVERARPRSMLCTPVVHQGERIGVVYLENDLVAGAFTPERTRVVDVLSAHAAIAIRNAELFDEVARLRDRLQAENVYLQAEIETRHGFEEIIGTSDALDTVLARVAQVAPTRATVLLTGETGTGKELLARAIHRRSPRHAGPFVAVNCGAIPAGLVESELFGHEKGAFTGAVGRSMGRFELAHGGTLFLDEVGELPPELQVRLLRVIEDGEVHRVGGGRAVRVDVRVIAATHRDLGRLVEDGRFRADLYYRLNVFPIASPALRERRADIPLLVRHFVQKDGIRLGRRIESIPRETLDALTAYAWPGNVRELRNVIERSLILSPGPALQLADWPPQPARTPHADDGTIADDGLTLDELERQHIRRTLDRVGWRVSGPRGAARLLGLKPTTLESRMRRLGITRPT